jgi:hypothetical protein
VKRSELEHIIRAAGEVSGASQIVVIGSQAILGPFPDAPAELVRSMEADVYPLNAPERATEIDGAIGELSSFHDQFGYYAQGVGPETATLPADWHERLVRVKSPATRDVEGLCLDVHDLAISKYVAGRDKDLAFTAALARRGMTRKKTLRVRLRATELDGARARLVAARIERDFLRRGRPQRR